MHILVTGATGWIGSEVVRELLEGGYSVTGLVRQKKAADALADSGATAVIGSLDQLNLLEEIAAAFGRCRSNRDGIGLLGQQSFPSG